jgi:hypothetical protein
MRLIFLVDAKLKDGSLVQLALADERDVEPLRQLHRSIFGVLCASSSEGVSVLW